MTSHIYLSVPKITSKIRWDGIHPFAPVLLIIGDVKRNADFRLNSNGWNTLFKEVGFNLIYLENNNNNKTKTPHPRYLTIM